jgi:hypothetical protein
MSNQLLFAAVSAAVIITLTGCNQDGVKVYHVETNDAVATVPPPTPDAQPAAMPSAMPAGLPTPDNSGLPQLKYTLPDGWKEKALTQMRVASFDITQNGKSVDVSVVPLGGMAGGDFANVNRWRGQLGLQPADDGTIQQLAEKVTVGGQPASLYDISGTSLGSGDAQRIIGVILHSDETVWFFKMDGDATLAESQKPALLSFLQSVQFASSGAPAPVDMSQLPPSHPPIAGMTAGGDTSAVQPTWTVPSGWQGAPLEQFLVAKFVIAGAGDAQAQVNVSSLANEGGGLGPNVNRWRGQLGLPPVDDAAATPLNVSGGTAQMVDLSGTDAHTGKPARLIGVIVPEGSQTWFYKLMGDPDVVAQQKDAFTGFVQSAKYPDAH